MGGMAGFLLEINYAREYRSCIRQIQPKKRKERSVQAEAEMKSTDARTKTDEKSFDVQISILKWKPKDSEKRTAKGEAFEGEPAWRAVALVVYNG